ncbi:hypothetical protein D3C73_205260 [compost metagenome]|jgi:hypothetical protein
MSNSIVSAVVDMLADRNPNAATRFARDFNVRVGDERDEIRELNRYWRDQLIRLHSSTISARTCLVDEVAPRDWLRHFEQLVLPTIVSHDLPTIH